VRLDDSKTAEIDAKTVDILADVFGDTEKIDVPINLSKVLEKYKIDLEYGKFPSNDISGAFDRSSNRIYISEDDVYHRQAFTLAHELGHIILHADKDKEIFYRYQTFNLEKENGVEETEANWFAASLLMPKTIILKFWILTKDVNKLADIFGVSNSAMFYRLKHLGLL